MENPTNTVLVTEPSADYELLDSGEGEKLERYGKITVSRPDPQSLWKKNLPESEWQKADARFVQSITGGKWVKNKDIPDKWKINLEGLSFWIKLSAFKHTGIFPEQLSNWKWIENIISGAGRKISVLNLFGYTGGATLASALAGAEVCHLDGSKSAISWAKDNAEISGLYEKPIRWILDDAREFVSREIRRGNKYDAIIMDPPAFGHGPKKELWKIEDDFLPFLLNCKKILSDKPLFFLINGYSSGYSALAYLNNLKSVMKGVEGNFEGGELAIKESSGERLLPAGIFARFEANGSASHLDEKRP